MLAKDITLVHEKDLIDHAYHLLLGIIPNIYCTYIYIYIILYMYIYIYIVLMLCLCHPDRSLIGLSISTVETSQAFASCARFGETLAVTEKAGSTWSRRRQTVRQYCHGSGPNRSFFPTCQVRVVRFYVRCPAPSFLLSFFPSFLPSCPPPPPAPRWTSSASSWWQWSSLDVICQHLSAVCSAGPQRLAHDRCGPRRTSTGESLSAVGLAGPQPARNNENVR